MTNNFKDFYGLLFNPGDQVCFSKDKYNTKVQDYRSWIIPSAQYFTVNACYPKRADDNTTSFRNFVFEWDKDDAGVEVPIENQLQIVKTVKLPFTTWVYSGGKSYHFILSLEECLGSKEVYTSYWSAVEHVFFKNSLTKPDHLCKNPTRFTRCPGGTNQKSGRSQDLIRTFRRFKRKEVDEWLESFGIKAEDFIPPPPLQMPDGWEPTATAEEIFSVIKTWPEKKHGVYDPNKSGNRHGYRTLLFTLCGNFSHTISKQDAIYLIESQFPLEGDTSVYKCYDKGTKTPQPWYRTKEEREAFLPASPKAKVDIFNLDINELLGSKP